MKIVLSIGLALLAHWACAGDLIQSVAPFFSFKVAAGVKSKPSSGAGRKFPPIQAVPITNQVVYVMGQVKEPGRFPWTNGITLTNVIGMAGGFTTQAMETQVEIRHHNGSLRQYNYPEILAVPTNNPALAPGDFIDVPRRKP